jgi:tetratricopeptide (TPR) repeat protein
LAEAEAAYSDAIEIAQALVTDFPDVQSHAVYHNQLVHSRTGLGIVLATMRRHSDAERVYRTAISEAETLVQAHPAVPAFRNNLARGRANLANLLQLLDRPQDAEVEYRAAIADLQSLLHTDPAAPDYRNRLAITRSNLGALLKNSGRPEDAEPNYRAAIEDYDALVNDNPAVPDYRAGQVAALQNLGHLLISQNKLEEAEESYRRATEAGNRLVAEQPNAPEYLELAGNACRLLGTLLRDLGPTRFTESLRVLDEAVRIHQALVDKNANVVQYRQILEASLQQRELTLAHVQRPHTNGGATPLIVQAAPGQDRPQAIRPLRSAAARRLSDIEIAPTVHSDAVKVYSNSKRLAVLPFVNTESNATIANDGIGFMEAMIADMRYVSEFLVLDGSEVLARVRANPAASMPVDLESAARLGQQLGVRCVIKGSFTVEADKIRLSAQAIDCSSPDFRVLASCQAVRPFAQICSLSDEVLQDLLKQMDSLPGPAKLQEMSRVPTTNFQARTECDSGFALLAQAAASEATEARKLSEQALQHAEAAVNADPNYVQAYILEASCLWNLERAADLEACLRAARIKSDPAIVDELTRLELEGDYAMFVERDFDKAIENYKRMLDIDAAHSRALLSLAGLYAGDFGAADAGIHDSDRAAEYAARLNAAHPGSSMAAPFEKAASKPVRPQED